MRFSVLFLLWMASCLVMAVPLAAQAGNAETTYNVRTDPRLPTRAVGDGQADDLAALTQDLTFLRQQAGGTLYLPAGTYRLDYSMGKGLSLGSGQFLTGDGIGKTILRGVGASPRGGLFLSFNRAVHAGISRLSLLNQTGLMNCNNSYKTCADITLDHVHWDEGTGRVIFLNNIPHLTVKNCHFEGTQSNYGSPYLDRDENLTFTDNYIHYHAGRFNMRETSGLVARNRVIATGGPILKRESETGGPEFSFAHDLVLSDNFFQTETSLDREHNDGECIMSQDQHHLGGGAAHNVRIERNTIVGYNMAIELYGGGVNVLIKDNICTNSDGIYAAPAGRPGTPSYDPLINCVITGNKISNPDGTKISHLTVKSPLLPGSVVLRDNDVHPHAVIPGVQAHSMSGLKNDGVFTP